MSDNFIAGLRSGSENQIQNTGRHSGGFKYLDDADRGAGRDCRRFENHCVAGDQGRREFPGRNRYRKIPWGDAGHNPERLFDCVNEVRRQFRENRFAVHTARFAGAKLGDVDRTLQLSPGFADRFAFFAGQGLRQLFLCLLHQPASLGDDPTAGRGGRAPPRVKSLGRRFDRRAGFFAGGLSICADDVFGVCRIDIVNGLR